MIFQQLLKSENNSLERDPKNKKGCSGFFDPERVFF